MGLDEICYSLERRSPGDLGFKVGPEFGELTVWLKTRLSTHWGLRHGVHIKSRLCGAANCEWNIQPISSITFLTVALYRLVEGPYYAVYDRQQWVFLLWRQHLQDQKESPFYQDQTTWM